MSSLLPLLALLALIPIVGLVLRCLRSFEVFKNVKSFHSYNRYKGRVLAETDKIASSSEDFRFVSENIIILGSGAILDFVSMGNNSKADGQLVAVDLTTEQSKVLDMNGFPAELAFRPHGMEYSKRTGTFYVVNHANDGEERIEMFTVENPDSIDNIKFTWKQCLRPPVPAGTTNAVTEASERDVYFTYWLPFPIPRFGHDHAKTKREHLHHIGNYAVNLLGRALWLPPFMYGFTSVMRCDLTTGAFEVAYPRFVSCNGITASADGKFVFVVDCFRQFIAVLERDAATGKLKKRVTYDLPHNPDNVTVRDLGENRYELSIGVGPDFWAYLMWSIKQDKRLVPGGFLRAVYDSVTDGMKFEDVLIHDGSLIGTVATAAQWKNKVILSGPMQGGGVIIFDDVV